ncbi:MAG: methyltransferase [Elusimicrobia bacterium]|nr:methyltransferase [Elusimicrobiota bacterium]
MNAAAWLAKGVAYLEEREVPEARANAEFLLAEVLGVGRGALQTRLAQELSEKQGFHYFTWIKERGKRIPLAYLLGNQPFLGLKIEVTRDSLIPRPETEELVLECERLVKALKVPAPKVLEIGTGTGCVAIALAQLLPAATVFATDVSDKALALALLDLEGEVAAGLEQLGRGLHDRADRVQTVLAPVQRQDRLGLHLGVAKLLHAAGFAGVVIKKDAQGHDRFALGRLPD